RAAHLARGRVDVGGRERAAPREPVEDAGELVGQAVEHAALRVSLVGWVGADRRQIHRGICNVRLIWWVTALGARPTLRNRGSQNQLRPRAQRAVGRWPPASRDRSADWQSGLPEERESLTAWQGSRQLAPNPLNRSYFFDRRDTAISPAQKPRRRACPRRW